MRIISMFAVSFLILSIGNTALAESARITCVCGRTYSFGGEIGDRFVSEGTVTFTADADDEWGYRSKAKSLCRKKLRSLSAEVGGCDYAD
jgi:hypothetical protein